METQELVPLMSMDYHSQTIIDDDDCQQPQQSIATSTSTIRKVCRVCGDRALGFNFNGLSCESCKIFFRRNAHRRGAFTCRRERPCEIDLVTRKCCQKCRLDKCYEIGMRRELIQSRAPRQPKARPLPPLGRNSLSTTTTSTTTEQTTSPPASCSSSSSPSSSSVTLSPEIIKIKNMNTIFTSDPQTPVSPQIEGLGQHELACLSELRTAMTTTFPHDERRLVVVREATSLTDAFNYPSWYIRRIVRFCKRLTAFRALEQCDQLALLKDAFLTVQTMRFAFLYDHERDGFPVELEPQEEEIVNLYSQNATSNDSNTNNTSNTNPNNSSNSAAIFIRLTIFAQYQRTDAEGMIRRLVEGLHREMGGDENLRDLFIAYLLFRPRENVTCPELIRYHHYVYRHLMSRYMECHYMDKQQSYGGGGGGSPKNSRLGALLQLAENYLQLQAICKQMAADIGHAQLNQVMNEIFSE